MLMANRTWLNILCLAASGTLLEAAVTGTGRTFGRGGVNRWHVAAWLRFVFAVAGFGLLALTVFNFVSAFLN